MYLYLYLMQREAITTCVYSHTFLQSPKVRHATCSQELYYRKPQHALTYQILRYCFIVHLALVKHFYCMQNPML